MHADPLPLCGCEPVQHTVDETDERFQQTLRWIELHREPGLREVDLHVVRTLAQAATDVALSLAHEVFEERISRVVRDPVRGVEQTQRGSRDDRLLDRNAGVLLGLYEKLVCVRPETERTSGQQRQLPRVTIREWDGDSAGREGLEPVDRIGDKAGLGLLAVGDDRRSGCLEALDGVSGRPVVQQSQLVSRDSAGGVALASPADISWGRDILVQPDLFVVPVEEARLHDWSQIRHLLLAVEILSPSSTRADRFTKRRLYQERGVPAYWMVDGDAQLVEIWQPNAELPVIERDQLTWHPSGAARPFTLELSTLFRPI